MIDRLPFSKGEIESSIPARFEKVVSRFGERTAIKGAGSSYSYAELDRLADRLAHAIIRTIGITPEPVVLIFDHEPAIAPGILGVLKAGKAYVALDPDYPPARSAAILTDLKPRLIITNHRNLPLASSLASGKCEVMDIDLLEPKDASGAGLPSIPTGALAGVFYTSGTTGQPKGVERSHQFILQRVWFETNDYHIQADDIFSIIHHFSFGASQVDIFDPLLNGATLCLYDIKVNSLAGLVEWLRGERVTFFHAPVDLFRRFLEGLTVDDYFPDLRQVTPSGRLYKQDVLRMREHIPAECLLVQRLASTETGMITHLKITKDTEITGEILPVGYAIEDKEVFIVDDTGARLEPGSVGEIAVTSRYLASGYWGQPELTRQAFQAEPGSDGKKTYRLGDLGRMRLDGCLELIGRKDSQAKIRGFRVELGEIEAALLNLDWIKEAAVIVQEHKPGENRLVAYVVPDDQKNFSIRRIRDELEKGLPDYMIPSVFITLESLPLTDRNKLDIKALPIPSGSRLDLDEKYLAPQNEIELVLAEIWSAVLDVKPIGINDNFFELGGHSLSAAQIISKTSNRFNLDIPLRTIVDHPTISGYTLALENIIENASLSDNIDLEQALRMLGYR